MSVTNIPKAGPRPVTGGSSSSVERLVSRRAAAIMRVSCEGLLPTRAQGSPLTEPLRHLKSPERLVAPSSGLSGACSGSEGRARGLTCRAHQGRLAGSEPGCTTAAGWVGTIEGLLRSEPDYQRSLIVQLPVSSDRWSQQALPAALLAAGSPGRALHVQ